MIRGVGTDLTDVSRIARMLGSRHGERFLARILTPAERQLMDKWQGRAAEFAAGRFAAKEAVSKALGSGIGATLSFLDMEIMPDSRGRPLCRLSERARAANGVGEGDRIHVSISHAGSFAVAFAVWEQ